MFSADNAVVARTGLYIVTVADPPADLAAIPGVRVIRELPPGRVVVAVEDPTQAARLPALPGVESVVEDRLEHPTGRVD